MPCKIEDYALIGDCETAALVGRTGSIDWLCWPSFDRGACFTALLGSPENGRWLIAPTDPEARVRRYRDNTLILETEFTTCPYRKLRPTVWHHVIEQHEIGLGIGESSSSTTRIVGAAVLLVFCHGPRPSHTFGSGRRVINLRVRSSTR